MPTAITFSFNESALHCDGTAKKITEKRETAVSARVVDSTGCYADARAVLESENKIDGRTTTIK